VSDGTASDTGTLTVTVEPDTTDPVVAAPSVAFGAGRVNESAPLLISWSAADSGTGVKSYEVQAKVGTGAWATIYTGTATSLTRSYAFGTNLQWQVRATDNADNVSAWIASPVRKLTAYQGTSPVVTTGSWTRVNSNGSSGTNYYYTTTSGKYKRLTFSGVAVAFVAPKSSLGGKVTVRIDSSTYALSTWTSGSMSLGNIVKAKSLGSGSHSILVINAQGGRRAYFDAFIVLR
jgi:hypothetical protein